MKAMHYHKICQQFRLLLEAHFESVVPMQQCFNATAYLSYDHSIQMVLLVG